MMILTPEQHSHFKNLFDCLQTHRIAYDTSPTGSGKTIVATKLAKRLNKKVIVVGSPILKHNWEKTMRIEGVAFEFMSVYSLPNKQLGLSNQPQLTVIMDECQLVKNQCKRTIAFMNSLNTNPNIKYVLMLSATPFDHQRHILPLSRFIEAISISSVSFDSVRFNMMFQYPTNVQYKLHHTQQTEEETSLYSQGSSQIRKSAHGDREGESRFTPELFSAGLQKVHSSLMSGLVRYVQSLPSRSKKIIVLKYSKQFKEFEEHFPNALVINGNVPQHSRQKIIDEFQNSSGGMLVITDVIGGVGIDLDDQRGNDHRTVIALPMFASDFVQLVGRVRRHNSKTNATVVVIQPNRKNTYFKRQMETKMPILKMFNSSLDFIDDCVYSVEHQSTCVGLDLGVEVGTDIARLIAEFACECEAFH